MHYLKYSQSKLVLKDKGIIGFLSFLPNAVLQLITSWFPLRESFDFKILF